MPYLVYNDRHSNEEMYRSRMAGLSLNDKMWKARVENIPLYNNYTYIAELIVNSLFHGVGHVVLSKSSQTRRQIGITTISTSRPKSVGTKVPVDSWYWTLFRYHYKKFLPIYYTKCDNVKNVNN